MDRTPPKRPRATLHTTCKRPSSRSRTVLKQVRDLFYDIMFVFEMPKVVHIRNPALGMAFRLVQLSILTYFVIFVMWWNKGYQSFDRALNGVTAKVSGVTWVGVNVLSPSDTPLLDNGDYQLQSLQNSGVYLTTRITGKTTQRLGYCAELATLPDAHCSADAHCTPGGTAGHSMDAPNGQIFSPEEIDLNDDAHGVFTGNCLREFHVCEIYGWCPVDSAGHLSFGRVSFAPYVVTPVNILQEPYDLFADLEFLQQHRSSWEPNNMQLVAPLFDVLNYTLFIRNAIEFPYFDVKRRNILPWMTEDFLHTCVYSPDSPIYQYCPIFRVYDMIRLAGANSDRMLYFGGVIAITIDWTCDLDWSVEYCVPKYEFRQLDHNPDSNESGSITSAGLAEGSAQELKLHYDREGSEKNGRYRVLLTTHGIAFIIRVTGQAGKFNLLSFTMKFGSGLALLSGATIMCDLIAFHFMRDRAHFREVSRDDKTIRRLLSMSANTTTRRGVNLVRRNAFHIRRDSRRIGANGAGENGNGVKMKTSALVPLITLSTTSFSQTKLKEQDYTGKLGDAKQSEDAKESNCALLRVDKTTTTVSDTSNRISWLSTRSSVSQHCYPITSTDQILSPLYSSLIDSASTDASVKSDSSSSDKL